jgi:hypothetical protein
VQTRLHSGSVLQLVPRCWNWGFGAANNASVLHAQGIQRQNQHLCGINLSSYSLPPGFPQHRSNRCSTKATNAAPKMGGTL